MKTGLFFLPLLLTAAVLEAGPGGDKVPESGWKKHVVHTGSESLTAIAADFTGDGLADVISNNGNVTRLFVAPDWKEVIVGSGHGFIHSAVLDVDGDGRLDYVGARYSPGLILWYQCPAKPASQPWAIHLVDDKINGTHGILKGDVDGDGKDDLLAGSALSEGAFPESLVWYRIPAKPRSAQRWQRHVFADKDAPGLGHYFGLGDVDGDGLVDASHAAKGGSSAEPGTGEWFAWWQAPKDPRGTWTKHLIAENQPGATNIHPADVNDDGKVDFIASRGHGRGVIWFEAPEWKVRTIHATLPEPHCLVVIDMDGDGDVDAATCSKTDRVAVWFENDGRGNFTTHVVGRDQSAYDIRAVDMEGDGDLDLLIAGALSNNVVWYENPRK
jgi:hypothetical protein